MITFELLQKVSQAALELRAKPDQLDKVLNPNIDRITVEKIVDLESTDADSSATIRAESYHSRFFSNSEQRFRELEKSYERLNRPQNLIVMICCRNHFQFLKLWLESCDKNMIQVRDRTLVFTLDDEAESQTKLLSLESYNFDATRYENGGQSDNFGDPNFSGAMYYKNAAICESLKLGANLLFQDVDLIWLRDPLPYLTKNNLESDLQIMFDGCNPWHYPYYANSGFIYIRNCDASKAVFETAFLNTSNIFQCGGHQSPLNRILHHFVIHNVLSLKILPEALFLNGHLFNLVTGVMANAGDWQNDGLVVHYSWTGNCEEKTRKLEKFNLTEYE
ncbi:MAG: putative nucleotide-diphospho-sugar transferase [Arenicella sp.]